MGGARWDPQQWQQNQQQTQHKPIHQVFRSTTIQTDLDPKGITVRESCDSDPNPRSTPIIVGVDVTGSMGELARLLVVGDADGKGGLGTLVESIYDRQPVTDPHVLLAAIGDQYSDSAPLQVTQFEADIRLVDQTKRLWLEGNGGGNGGESYALLWYFAAMKTKIDSMAKRKKKGYLFTIGDERVHEKVESTAIERVFGKNELERDITAKELLAIASRSWEIFHLVVEESGAAAGQRAQEQWKELLGERALPLSDHRKMAEVIVSTIQVCEGANAQQVTASWDGKTQAVVARAIGGLAASGQQNAGLVQL